MSDFIKKNIYLIFLFIITLSIGFLTFLTFIDKGFIELSDQNLQFLLILNIVLLIILFIFIFLEIKKTIKNDIDKDGLKSNNAGSLVDENKRPISIDTESIYFNIILFDSTTHPPYY